MFALGAGEARPGMGFVLAVATLRIGGPAVFGPSESVDQHTLSLYIATEVLSLLFGHP
jgi:hypothetical protein